jgi:hypothetical protein
MQILAAVSNVEAAAFCVWTISAIAPALIA